MIGSNGNQLSEMGGFLKKGKLYLDTRNVLKAIQFSNVDLGFSDKKNKRESQNKGLFAIQTTASWGAGSWSSTQTCTHESIR